MLLRVTGLTKSFGDVKVLEDFSIEADRGQVVSIIGSSGSGKSTALRCINFLEMPNSMHLQLGDMLVDVAHGQLASKRQIEALRRQLAMVFQSFNLWLHLTVLENCTLAPRSALGLSTAQARERAMANLELVGMAGRAASYPNQLSGGQQQRVAIARALAMEPQAILFDEPTSALDPELVGEVLEVMRAIAKTGRTMLVVTHEMGFARELSDRVVFLHQGRVEESGPPAQVLAHPSSPRLQQFLANKLK